MIIVGIPTYNEADNISLLTKHVDLAAQNLGLAITIVNADSASTDNTPRVFNATHTKAEKISIISRQKGKGHNIYSILEYVAGDKSAIGCILIDGDIKSFDESWLADHVHKLSAGYDYVVPTYARNFQEGNTTNHFAYPLLGMHTNGLAPRQPIAGDFGISASFARYITTQTWRKSTYGYGIDIFLTMHALFGGFKVTEIQLGMKMHKPSFGKMIPMFREVATSYYETAQQLIVKGRNSHIHFDQADAPEFIDADPLSTAAIELRRKEAFELYSDQTNLVASMRLKQENHVSAKDWVSVLIAHEKLIGSVEPARIASSILPWYLMRVVSYLSEIDNATQANTEISGQYSLAVRQWNRDATDFKK